MNFELKYQGRDNVAAWFGKLTSQGAERTLIHKSLVPRPPKGAVEELRLRNRWVIARDGDYWTYWQESE